MFYRNKTHYAGSIGTIDISNERQKEHTNTSTHKCQRTKHSVNLRNSIGTWKKREKNKTREKNSNRFNNGELSLIIVSESTAVDVCVCVRFESHQHHIVVWRTAIFAQQNIHIKCNKHSQRISFVIAGAKRKSRFSALTWHTMVKTLKRLWWWC